MLAEGVFLRGAVRPAIEGVEVRVFPRDQANDDEQPPLRTARTAADGRYSIGPLHDNLQYR